MADVAVGGQYKLNRRTFLHKGIFVNQGVSVQVMEITDGPDKVIVQFLDREGFPHILTGIGPEELE
ncbi:MAG TPA: hypothetical protein PKE49_06795 [Leptospiraceae bacterium]|nr:hypothetical protein [Leptospirales bacterium]HMU83108.1 hypothetical protein [Leptospiraceae bacterium]HMX56213.1 hypothetical protein [Leptospiraceae bacterium]HMY44929.1 hypothetical protein [Leptospiraceae bacterium]HNE25450.1 hypothetical protein [Leptospiraceae bacterium]